MESNIKYDEINKIIRITTCGEYEHEKAMIQIIDSFDFARKKKCNRFLVDFRMFIISHKIFELYDIIQNGAHFGILKTDLIAFICPSIDKTIYEFCDTVAFNRGWINHKIFMDFKEGEKWLLSDCN